MAVSLIAEVMDFATGSQLTPTERYILVSIAEQANAKTREAWQEHGGAGKRRWVLHERVGLSETGLRTALQRLAGRGLEVRVPIGTNSQGRVFYALSGHQTTYRLPVLLKRRGDAQASPSGDVLPSNADASPSAKGDAQAFNADVLPSYADVQPSAKRQLGDAQASPYPSENLKNNSSSRAREPRNVVIEQTDAKPSEAEAVIARIQNEINPRSLGGFVAHLAREGDLQRWVDEARAAQIRAEVRETNDARRRMPPCEHGENGGDQLHPISGEPWCIDCRFRHRATRLNSTARNVIQLHPRETA